VRTGQMTQLEPLEWEASVDVANGPVLTAHYDDGYYRITQGWMSTPEKPRWVLHGRRDDKPSDYMLIGDETIHDSAEEAKAVAEKMRASSHRAALWKRYMADNDPPCE
jgi:hypothetical protein